MVSPIVKEDEGKFKAEDQVKLKKVHEMLEQPDKFAEVFCKVAETQIKVRDIFRKEILKSISTDVDCRNHLKGIIRKVEREDVIVFGKKIGFGVWTIIVFILGAIVNAFLSKYIH